VRKDGHHDRLDLYNFHVHCLGPFSIGSRKAITAAPRRPGRLLSEFGRRLAEHVLEGAGKRFWTFKSGIKRDIDNAILVIERQPVRSPLELHQLNIATDVYAAVFRKLAVKVKFGKARNLAQILDRERLVEMLVDIVQNTVEAARVAMFLRGRPAFHSRAYARTPAKGLDAYC
jgi:hypothetical protein